MENGEPTVCGLHLEIIFKNHFKWYSFISLNTTSSTLFLKIIDTPYIILKGGILMIKQLLSHYFCLI